jgi:serine/threonine-protein kinase
VPAIGTVLGGKYRVEAKIGEGGMGTVFRAENTVTGKKVALKWMHPHVAANPIAAERFLREARASARLSHPNIVDVYDVVRDAGTLFLVMELLQGCTLRAFMTQRPKPSLAELIALLLPALGGVAAAHEQGVIHRDLKPDNIFLVRPHGSTAPIAKVLDFGIAKLASSHGSTLTETGSSLGTPAYMSFEQLRGDKDIDGRVDVYAFGVMLFEAITGRRPYRGATLSELAIYVATTQPATVGSLRADIPEALAAIVDRAVARDRQQRWPDVPSLMEALVPFASEPAFRAQLSQPTAAVPCVAEPMRDPGTTGSSQWEPPLAATAALSGMSAAPVPRTMSLGEAPPDTLSARELRHDGRQHPPSWPIWVAAGVALTVSAVAAFLLIRASNEPAPQAGLPAHDPVPVAQPTAAVEPPLPTVQITPPPPPPPPPLEPAVHEDPDAPSVPARALPKPARASRTRAHAAPHNAAAEHPATPAADKPAARNPADLLGF